ncbi:MAG TPA: hypothetical protein VLA97_01575 [Nocardioidaceae bacterium]|nr:hypothetical protein [Nocardioidaceae bacterium]
MNKSKRPRLVAGLRRHRASVGIAVVSTAVAVAGLGAAPTASSAPDPSCPQAADLSTLERGDEVTGATVAEGTEPAEFTGEYVGRIKDGIAPGLDMVMVELTSDDIDEIGGIWAGMSGSPVYDSEGDLIGAVAYGLASGASPVAGVTPAGEMLKLLSDAATDSGAARTLADASSTDEVAVPPRLASRLAASGAVETAAAAESLTRLRLPVGISGLAGRNVKKAARDLGLKNVRVYATGAVNTQDEEIPLETGGNLAASISYGDISAVGVGTATAVCGGEVLGFGHPMMYTGPSTLTMHGADAVYVQKDAFVPFKVANPAAPMGTITQDRLAGILGKDGGLPATTHVRSYVTVDGETTQRRGQTHVSVPNAVPDIAAFHLLANQDRVYDAITGGSALVGWTVTGTRANGTSFKLTRFDRFANDWDISFEPTFDLFDQLYQLQFNNFEKIRITNIQERSAMNRVMRAYKVAKVEVRSAGRWARLRTNQALVLRAGTTKPFRVTLTSAELQTRRLRVELKVPVAAGRKGGYLEVLGGNSWYGGEGEGGSGPANFDQLLRRLRSAPRNDEVLVNLYVFRNNGTTIKRTSRTRAGAVVDGGTAVEVLVMPAR